MVPKGWVFFGARFRTDRWGVDEVNEMMVFGASWAVTQLLSVVALQLGSRWAGSGPFQALGAVAHRQKIQALDRVWPLTRVRPAADRGDHGTLTRILAALIALKSAACLVAGAVVVFWLPLASLVVPAIVAVHEPGDADLDRWIRRVAMLQVTSHALAAAAGFTVFFLGPWRGVALTDVLGASTLWLVPALLASLYFAWAAGRLEARGVVERGI